MWALSYYLTQLSLGPEAVASRLPEGLRRDVVGKATPDRGGPRKPPMQLPVEFQTVETRCAREGHTRPRGPSEKPRWSGPQGLWLNIRRTIWHNVTVITVGSKYEVYVQSPASSHMQTLERPFLEVCNKVRGKYIWKEVFLRLYPALFLPVSSSCIFLDASFIIVSVFTQYIYVYFCMNQQMTMQHRERSCTFSYTSVL